MDQKLQIENLQSSNFETELKMQQLNVDIENYQNDVLHLEDQIFSFQKEKTFEASATFGNTFLEKSGRDLNNSK